MGGSSRPQPRGARALEAGADRTSEGLGLRVAAGALDQGVEPALGDEHVVVHEGDQRRAGLAQAGVAGGVEAAPLAVAHPADPVALGHIGGGVGGPVVDDEELMGGLGALALQRVERHLEIRRAAARGDHHRDRRRLHRR